jgi:hypothetical protein
LMNISRNTFKTSMRRVKASKMTNITPPICSVLLGF